jgi:hypothetical protein
MKHSRSEKPKIAEVAKKYVIYYRTHIMKLLGLISVGFDVTDQLLITFSYIRQIVEKKLGIL